MSKQETHRGEHMHARVVLVHSRTSCSSAAVMSASSAPEASASVADCHGGRSSRASAVSSVSRVKQELWEAGDHTGELCRGLHRQCCNGKAVEGNAVGQGLRATLSRDPTGLLVR